MTSAEIPNAGSAPRRRLWPFRLFAVLLGLSLFAVAELVCVLFGWGRPTDFDDPFVGFSEIHPLFVLDESGEHYMIPPSRRKFFAPESFPAEKGPETLRIFCLGGSTVQGRPYSTPTSFTTFLELNLTAADSSRNWEVINCGGISYASYRLAPILQECLGNYQPDLIVLCTGHNEFLEERTYDHIKHASGPLAAVQRRLARLRSYVLLREAVHEVTGESRDKPPPRPEMTADANALLDYKNGLAAYHRDDEWRAGVIAHYENNLRRMVGMAERSGVPLLLIRPPSNLADFPPFKSEHSTDLSEEELRKWRELFDEAQANYRTNLNRSIELLGRALEIDGRYAGAWYELGKCYETRGLRDQARKAFRRAREEDICPLRILEPMEEALARVAEETGTPLIDAFALLEAMEPNRILGDYMLVDHIHPSFEGHQVIADAIAEEMVRQEILRPGAGWENRKTEAYKQHVQSLDDLYYLRGQRTLDAVMEWAKGRADGPPVEERTPNGILRSKM